MRSSRNPEFLVKSIIEYSSLSFYLPPNSPKLPSKVPSGVAALEYPLPESAELSRFLRNSCFPCKLKLTCRTHDSATWSGMNGHIHWYRQKWRQTYERWKSAQLPCVSAPADSFAPSQSPTTADRPTLHQTRSPWKECVLTRVESDDSLGDAVDGQAAHYVSKSGQCSL